MTFRAYMIKIQFESRAVLISKHNDSLLFMVLDCWTDSVFVWTLYLVIIIIIIIIIIIMGVGLDCNKNKVTSGQKASDVIVDVAWQ